MALMLCRLFLLILPTTMALKNETTSGKIFKVTRYGSLMMCPGHLEGVKEGWDFRWSHRKLYLNNRTTKCPHGRCELLKNGSISFSQVQPEDSGNYTLEVFDEKGMLQTKTTFMVQVDVPSSSRTEKPAMFLWLLLLFPLACIIFFILRRMKMHKLMPTDQKESNVYMEMKGCHGHKKKQKEESVYVTCHPSVKQEDVYV